MDDSQQPIVPPTDRGTAGAIVESRDRECSAAEDSVGVVEDVRRSGNIHVPGRRGDTATRRTCQGRDRRIVCGVDAGINAAVVVATTNRCDVGRSSGNDTAGNAGAGRHTRILTSLNTLADRVVTNVTASASNVPVALVVELTLAVDQAIEGYPNFQLGS